FHLAFGFLVPGELQLGEHAGVPLTLHQTAGRRRADRRQLVAEGGREKTHLRRGSFPNLQTMQSWVNFVADCWTSPVTCVASRTAHPSGLTQVSEQSLGLIRIQSL